MAQKSVVRQNKRSEVKIQLYAHTAMKEYINSTLPVYMLICDVHEDLVEGLVIRLLAKFMEMFKARPIRCTPTCVSLSSVAQSKNLATIHHVKYGSRK